MPPSTTITKKQVPQGWDSRRTFSLLLAYVRIVRDKLFLAHDIHCWLHHLWKDVEGIKMMQLATHSSNVAFFLHPPDYRIVQYMIFASLAVQLQMMNPLQVQVLHHIFQGPCWHLKASF